MDDYILDIEITTTNHFREDLLQGLSSSSGLVCTSIETVFKGEQVLSHWIAVGHLAIVYQCDAADTPTLHHNNKKLTSRGEFFSFLLQGARQYMTFTNLLQALSVQIHNRALKNSVKALW